MFSHMNNNMAKNRNTINSGKLPHTSSFYNEAQNIAVDKENETQSSCVSTLHNTEQIDASSSSCLFYATPSYSQRQQPHTASTSGPLVVGSFKSVTTTATNTEPSSDIRKSLLFQPPENENVEVNKSNTCETSSSTTITVANSSRENDQIYSHVLSVVKSINVMSKTIANVPADQYVDLVKDVGVELKVLLSAADDLLDNLPSIAHSEVLMAEKVLGSCMQKLVGSMRLAVQNAQTALDAKFRHQMLSDAHVLAVECKNFLQAVDSARLQAAHSTIIATNEENRNYQQDEKNSVVVSSKDGRSSNTNNMPKIVSY